MHRFFLPPERFASPRVKIAGETAEQIRRVLRMRPGDKLILLDGMGGSYLATLVEYGKGEVWVDIEERRDVLSEPRIQVDLYLATLNKPDKYEWALQKCTELGAACFCPLIAERSIAGATGKVRSERWTRIIQEAAEQSGRGIIPRLAESMNLPSALKKERDRLDGQAGSPLDSHLALMPEVGQGLPLQSALQAAPRPSTISLFIGPEGGFSLDEVAMAQDVGVQIVSMGPRILRAETAAVVGLTVVMSVLSELD